MESQQWILIERKEHLVNYFKSRSYPSLSTSFAILFFILSLPFVRIWAEIWAMDFIPDVTEALNSILSYVANECNEI